jgi:hypothetical protein
MFWPSVAAGYRLISFIALLTRVIPQTGVPHGVPYGVPHGVPHSLRMQPVHALDAGNFCAEQVFCSQQL